VRRKVVEGPVLRDAHAQKIRDEVFGFADANLDMDSDEFALGQSASFLDVHRIGVVKFRRRARVQGASQPP
jgi:hypothetical protein